MSSPGCVLYPSYQASVLNSTCYFKWELHRWGKTKEGLTTNTCPGCGKMVNDTEAGPALFPSHQRAGDMGTVKCKQNPSLKFLRPCYHRAISHSNLLDLEADVLVHNFKIQCHVLWSFSDQHGMIHLSLESSTQVSSPNELLGILVLFSFLASRPQPDGNLQHRITHNVKPLTLSRPLATIFLARHLA